MTSLDNETLTKAIIAVLDYPTGEGLTAGEVRSKVAKATGATVTKSDCNKVLYGLERDKKTTRNDETPPLWFLAIGALRTAAPSEAPSGPTGETKHHEDEFLDDLLDRLHPCIRSGGTWL